jgi:hypothetical protein
MAKNSETRDPLPEHFATLHEAATFWETHDLTDYWDQTEEVQSDVRIERRAYLFALAPDLAERLAAQATRQGLSAETLINLWLSERLRDAAA